MKENRIRNSE